MTNKKQLFMKIGMFLLVLSIMFSIPFLMLYNVNKWITTCDNLHWDNSTQIVHSFLPYDIYSIKLRCSNDNFTMAFANVSRAVTFNLIK